MWSLLIIFGPAVGYLLVALVVTFLVECMWLRLSMSSLHKCSWFVAILTFLGAFIGGIIAKDVECCLGTVISIFSFLITFYVHSFAFFSILQDRGYDISQNDPLEDVWIKARNKRKEEAREIYWHAVSKGELQQRIILLARECLTVDDLSNLITQDSGLWYMKIMRIQLMARMTSNYNDVVEIEVSIADGSKAIVSVKPSG